MNELMAVLQELKEAKTEITIYVLNGFQCKGTIVSYDRKFVIIEDVRARKEKIILMSAISTIEY